MEAHCKFKKMFFVFTSDFLKTIVLSSQRCCQPFFFFMVGCEREEFRVTTMDLYR